ncbi:hypothetical protein M422DRAFT_170377, partial [Sphaerobolus stellatus SS14]
LLSQSNPGSENYGVVNAQTFMHHSLDPSLSNACQHCFKRRRNIKTEIEWSQYHFKFSPGFENLLDWGVNERSMM